ncbi:probable serine/threonine-protein kinase WNK6 [Chenopodium quinoa]|uniref:non-specific serine/threonine protein kinase n=1 Tax=Chenopodium quinoa TaxID=63459 RepID=A0A803LV95_CHEQI|nr:probable serine/threonine-protein kinase WNK6 [Chenopodium quinoa]
MASSSRYESEFETIVNNHNDLERDPTRQFIRFNKVVGIGTSKRVYEGLDTYNGIKIAWSKIEVGEITEAESNKRCQEAEMMKSLNHQNILKCYTYWYDGRKFINIITDLCSSGNLRDYILKHDLFHCTVKLAGFGVAVYKEAEYVNNASGGTPEYMAPEIYRGKMYNELVDIHSFGMTVLQMVTYDKIYCEYEGLDYLNDVIAAVEAGFFPVALSKVDDYDPQLLQFIQKCVAPASLRPAALELFREPFLVATGEHDRSQDRPTPSRFRSLRKLSLTRKSRAYTQFDSI